MIFCVALLLLPSPVSAEIFCLDFRFLIPITVSLFFLSLQFSGIVLLAVGIWGKVSLEVYFSLLNESATNVPYVLIGTGAVVILLGTFGCFATCRGSTWMLKLVSANSPWRRRWGVLICLDIPRILSILICTCCPFSDLLVGNWWASYLTNSTCNWTLLFFFLPHSLLPSTFSLFILLPVSKVRVHQTYS